jgi:alkylation response protein AidB-like acyl-CoA dehydrogenase
MGAMQYDVDLTDIQFVLFDQLDIDAELSGIEKYADFDKEIYDATLEEAARISREVLHPIDGPGDRQGCSLDIETGNVTTPDGYKEAYRIMGEGGWISVTADPEIGGVGMPAAIGMAVVEMFIGAAMAFEMYPGLTAAAARVIHHHGPEAWRIPYAEKMMTGDWGGTMCLTEAGAGSDVGENRCRATPLDGEEGTFLLEGEKIFISGGDSDLTENILHLVLARTPGSPAGTRGLSLFLVPKFLINDDLSLGERNGAYVVGIEEKMGIHGSSTCTIALGGRGPCRGWLVGKEREGIKIMFLMMNEARIGVGAQGVAVAAAAHHYAKNYAMERLQGSSVENFKDANAPRVPISAHPDVRRMLMTQKVLVEACRSMYYRLGHRLDIAENNPEKHDQLMGRIELLVPILKAHCTDLGFEVAVSGLQVLGGYGYIGEYPLEQIVRDAKICSIYEGTNGIQAMDLVGRKMNTKGGALFMSWMQDAMKECAAASAVGFEAEAGAL